MASSQVRRRFPISFRSPLQMFSVDDPDPKEMTIIEHLEELRTRLIVSIVAIAVTSVVSFFVGSRWLLSVLLVPIHKYATHFITLAPTGAFGIELKLAVILGTMIAVPVWLYQVWMFIVPAVDVEVRRYLVPFMLLGILLFALGIVLGYEISPLALNFLIGMGGGLITYLPDVDRYVTQIGLIMLIFGVMFELPIVLTLLARIGIISSALLRRKRRIGIFSALVASLIVAPGTDLVTPIILFFVLVVLYEFSIILIRFIHR